MSSFLNDYLDRLTTLHTAIADALADLPDEALDWKPRPDVPSIAVLIAHIAGAERYWVGDLVGQSPSGRVRDDEFRTSGRLGAELQTRLDEVLDHSRSVLQGMSLDALATPLTDPRNGREITAGWALAHALEHTAIHLGHIQILRQWWETAMSTTSAGV